MSFAVSANGSMYVLDQVNDRIMRTDADGTRTEMKIARPTTQDIALGRDGSMALLDRFSGKDVTLFDANGNPRGSLPLVGEGLDNPGLVTGVFIDGNDVYVEREHGPLVLIGTTDGAAADPRTEIVGRPTRDGKAFISAGITDAQAGRVYVSANERPSQEAMFTRELRLEAEVHSILLLDTDLGGTIYFGVQVAEEGNDVVVLTCLDGQTGAPTGNAILPANTMPEETFRDFTVLDEGGVMFSHRTEQGVSYTRYECN